MPQQDSTVTDDAATLAQVDVDHLHLFLDFDGTLVDLAPTHDGVKVPDDLGAMLQRLHDRLSGRLCLVSGREIATLERFLPGFPGDIFGAHGAESRRVGELVRHPLVGSDLVADVQRQAQEAVDATPGLTLETKDTGAVIHFRATPAAEPEARKAADRIADAAEGMEMHVSKMAFEIRPSDASKATAVRTVMNDHPPGIVPVVIGDDVTDEEAMAVANDLGGFCVRVGEGDTCAAHRLPDPAAVRRLLDSWSRKDAS